MPDNDVRVIAFEGMKYPSVARFANIQGVVVIRISIDRNGVITDVRALSGATLLVTDSIENARKWRFAANSEGAVFLVYDFKLGGLCPHNDDSSELILHPPNLATITACSATVE